MKKILTLVTLVLSLLSIAQAQKTDGIIKGKLTDTAAKQPIVDVTISVINTKDSSLVTFTLSNKQGAFEIKGLADGEYQLVFSHQAYQPFKRLATVTADKKTADFGDIAVAKDFKSLGEVVVTNTVPISVKGDTVQFNAEAFKTKPNATAEDLLKKLPGVELLVF